VRKPLIVMAALSAALSAGVIASPAGAAVTLPKVTDIATPSVGPLPAVSGYGTTPLGDITLGFHGQPPPATAAPKVADVATRSVGPFPAVSGYSRTALGDISLGFHGQPPAGARSNRRTLRSAAHKHARRHAARAKHRSGWG
jgi:hypothetical protein